MHHDLARPLAPAFHLVARHVANDQVVRLHHALADAGGSAEHAILADAVRDVAVVGRDPILGPQVAADFHDVLAQLLFVGLTQDLLV